MRDISHPVGLGNHNKTKPENLSARYNTEQNLHRHCNVVGETFYIISNSALNLVYFLEGNSESPGEASRRLNANRLCRRIYVLFHFIQVLA